MLPHDQQRVYRIKDLFIDTYRKKISRYRVDEIEYARVRFHSIFADNRLYVFQAFDETKKLKMIADGDHYYITTLGDRNVVSRTQTKDTSNDTSTNTSKSTGKSGQLVGSVDAIQLGSVLDADERVIDTNKLPDFFDQNVRGYNQGVNVNDGTDTSTASNSGTSTSDVNITGNQATHGKKGVDAMNQYRAHSMVVRRLREEFVQCFNVMFW